MKKTSLLFLALATVLVVDTQAQVARVITLADSLVGGVGGVAVDRMGNIFSADFMDSVWRIRPDGRVSKFASGFYGASGNAFDSKGTLYQASFFGHYLSRVDRHGNHEVWVDEGLNGPVGVAIKSDGSVFVNNCSGNTVSRIGSDGVATMFASGNLFSCPNGITVGPDSALYVVNFRDGRMIRIDESGRAELFATVPGGGNGHVAVARGSFYVTAFQSNRIYQVTMDGSVTLVAGTGQFGEQDGAPLEALFTFPNGIASNAAGDRLIVNDYINRTPPGVDVPPVPLANIRLIKLESISDVITGALRSGGITDMEVAYRAFKSDPSTATLFTEREVNGYGYAMMNQGQLDVAIRLFELNAESYPNSFNVWDSLAESYMNKGRTREAIANYEKSLSINPGNQNAHDMIAKIKAK
ncbi:MAG: tetratricopeptide repeat protein [Rhodothermales bacterium]|nr:tetratricopeptide repeat protein [Rhodothermales bacterium]